MNIVDILLDPFAYAFMTRALWATLIASVVCALLSCWLVLIGWSLMGDAVSHAVIIVADLDAEVKGQGGDPQFALENAVRRIAELA